MGGYSDDLNENNEDQFKYIYKYDHVDKNLKIAGSMCTFRHSFGVCKSKNYIYIIGGMNHLTG